MLKRQYYLDKIKMLMDTNEIKLITGVRRSGKTYFLKSIMEELKNRQIHDDNIIFISFESGQYRKIRIDTQLDEIVKSLIPQNNKKVYLLFDEIQRVSGWEESIASYLVDYDCDIYITGSNSKMLSGELSTNLSGRYVTLELFPFSFKEIMEYNEKILEKKVTLELESKLFEEYLEYGGFPGLLQYNENESKQNYLKSTYDSIVLHDILERSNIRDFDLLERLLDFLISNTGQMYSANSISKYLKEDNKYIKRESRDISVKTLINYNDNIQKSMIISKCKREDIIGKKKLKFLEKYYVVDLGFYTLLNENKRNYGQILETIVYNELRRRGYAVTVGEVNNLEVDFIARKFKKKIYVQVSTNLQDDKTREREFKSLKKIKDNFQKYIISNETFDFSEDGIIHLNIKEFLKKETF